MTTADAIFQEWAARPGRHIVNLSGGKDSTALAIFMRGKIPQLEYIFCDTHKELPETYEYLDRLEAYLGRPIVRLNAERGFDHWLDMYGGMLPSARVPFGAPQAEDRAFRGLRRQRHRLELRGHPRR